ncbi:PREDICTED: uncharacterized protein LOC105956953 [Erythranthe guttata]|uniref:uncharacterized protein LOC105956953 n=1 Tax=Erythranthe guttata TaxID=4155 RepID=UPI00064D7F2B|nr:PREDICTED: uncharacterized protein LOC105956953 [Erythranthe guttata]|eukprot:XP_012836320.1 PREDICTED: uncharacterized protein LOC105956953 [Erythranthe guttata]
MARRLTRNSQGTPTNEPTDVNQTIHNLSNLIREQAQNHQRQIDQLFRRNHPPPPPSQAAPHAIYERFLKMNPFEFHGGTDPTIAEEWVKSLEVIYDYMQMTDRDRVHCALFLLRNEARHWWEGVKEGVDLDTIQWTDFKLQFFEKYFSKDVRAHKLKEFLELRQGELPMLEYIRRFERGCLYAPFIARDPEEKKNHFIRGLQPEIRRDIRMSDASTFRQLVDKALMAAQDEKEIQQNRRSQGTSQCPWKKPNVGNHKFKGNRGQPSNQSGLPQPPKPICSQCGKAHFGACVQGTNTCFRCRKTGHIAMDCPNAQNRAQGRVFAMTKE